MATRKETDRQTHTHTHMHAHRVEREEKETETETETERQRERCVVSIRYTFQELASGTWLLQLDTTSPNCSTTNSSMN
jgi:hypothetical protein